MKINHAISLFLVAGAVLLAQPAAAQPAAQGASCETIKRLAVVQDGARQLVAESAALGTAGAGGSPAVPAPWLEKFRKEAGTVKANADKVFAAPSQPDPEAVFYLGKHMNDVQALWKDDAIASVRARNTALESLARQSEVLAKDVGFVLANVSALKEEARRCNARKPG